MRRAHTDVGWIIENGQLVGLNLGFDHCAEHEWGIDELLLTLGIDTPRFPMGISDRTMTRVPESLRYAEVMSKPKDKRRKAQPTALLIVKETYREVEESIENLVQMHELGFYGEPEDSFYQPKYDLACSWSRSGFAVRVRGAENIERLRELHQALLNKDVAIGLPRVHGFSQGGLSLVIASRMADELKASILAQDEAYKELHLAVDALGIEERLKAANLKWHALRPAWFDSRKDEVVFFLNPQRQREFNYGWFTVRDLEEWIEGKGPVVKDAKLEARAADAGDWSYRLLKGLNEAGIAVRYRAALVWMDEAKTIPGLRVRVARASEHLLASGDYPFDELMSRYASQQAAIASAAG